MIDIQELYQQVVVENLGFIAMSTALFFITSILLLLFLSLLQLFIEKRRKRMAIQRRIYVEQINNYIFFGHYEIKLTGVNDYYALADAIIELNNFVSKEDRGSLYDIMQQYDLEGFLLKRYQRSILTLSKRFVLSKLLFISSPRLKEFYLEQIKQQNFEGMLYAIYSYAELAKSHQDLLLITHALLDNYERGISLKFCEFVFTEAFESAPTQEIRIFLEHLYKEEISLLLLKGIISAIGDMNYQELKDDILPFFERHHNDTLFLVTYIRTLNKMGIEDCKLIKEAYLHQDPVIRINLSKYALGLCPDSLQMLYLYMFDQNYYVRRNFFEALKEQNISRTEIESLVHDHAPNKADDRFFLDALNAFFPKEVA